MALADFIQSLQEQDTVYSTPPQPSIRVIPPEKQNIKVIPPETLAVEQPTPKVIKLKIKPKTPVTTQQPAVTQSPQPVAQQPQVAQPKLQPVQPQVNSTLKTVSKPAQQSILQPVNNTHSSGNQIPTVQQMQPEIPKYVPNDMPQTSQPKPQVQQKVETHVQHPDPQPIVEKVPMTNEDIFYSTGTEESKKALWLDYFEKAKTSRKSNPIVDRMKVGRFTITPDNKVLLLPDYDIVGKDPDDVLKDKWF